MKDLYYWICLVLAATLAACAPEPAAGPSTSEADEAVLRSVADKFLTAVNAADLTAFGALFAEDAIEMQPNAAPHEGLQAILESQREFFAQFTATQSATVAEVGVQGNLGFTRGTWNVRSAPKAGGPETTRSGKWMVLFKRQADASWKIWRWIWNEQPTAP